MSNATDMLAAYQQAELDRLPLVQAGRREWERRVASETAAAAGRGVGISLADFREGCAR